MNAPGIEFDFHVTRTAKGRKVLKKGPAAPQPQVGSAPRICYAELARLGHVTRARVSQIVDLLNLAPDLQEHLLMLPPCSGQRHAVSERQVRSALRLSDWTLQREALTALRRASYRRAEFDPI
jgi:hypothetical protein